MWAQLTKACLRLEEIETQLSQPETYDDPDLAASLNKEQKDLLPLVEAYRQHQKAQSDLDGLADLLDDPECRQLAKAEETALRAELDRLEEELRLLLQPKDPMDGKDVFLEIRAGVGGEEAALFAADLFRMYSMYGEKQGWRLELTNVNQTELGGVKELSCLVKGETAYARLKHESGVHRVQRVPETESGGRIHTSTCTVAVLPQVDEVDLFKLGESDRNKMAEILADIPDYCTVVFTYETTPWKPDKRLKKLWEAIDGAGLIVEFAKQDQKDLAAWVTRHFMARDKRISTDLCLYLIDITGGTMTALSGEIDKICAYSGANEIRKTDIDAVTEPVLDAVVFQMTDMLSAGRFDQALVKLQQLLKMQQEPLAILGAVGNHFRRVSAARTLLDNGKNASDLQRLCGIPDYPARKTMEAARRFTPEFCRRAAELVLETDYKIKTSYDDPERLLELLLLQLAQEGRNG